ncbi:exopolysaccharide biosynthesis protein [Agrobacterium tumefaciens]|uniref:exopolysaccharide biosynthesis protein n=1 Tax=Agrobacterium tumefaciens TaxID=358 RepID=UPI00287E7E0D|nr:exopolysaccharide biosynthesis protein [Agrobacterium tumefaciens]MDS7594035.1 exopolysaccharide biosynthesis protein [Agrobacterium tumefaciens]
MATCHYGTSTASTTLCRLVAEAQLQDGLTITETLRLMGESAFGFVILLLALPAVISIPGPFGMVFGSALAIVSLQLAFGLKSLWLPSFIGNRRISAKAFAAPRVSYMLALPVFCLAVAVALPIPFGNITPVAALFVIAIGLIERDGLVVLLGLGMTLIAVSVTVTLLSMAASVVPWF